MNLETLCETLTGLADMNQVSANEYGAIGDETMTQWCKGRATAYAHAADMVAREAGILDAVANRPGVSA